MINNQERWRVIAEELMMPPDEIRARFNKRLPPSSEDIKAGWNPNQWQTPMADVIRLIAQELDSSDLLNELKPRRLRWRKRI